MAKTDDKKKKKAAPKKKSAPSPAAPSSETVAEPELEMRSPVGPLLWLLIPFIGVILYGLLTRD